MPVRLLTYISTFAPVDITTAIILLLVALNIVLLLRGRTPKVVAKIESDDAREVVAAAKKKASEIINDAYTLKSLAQTGLHDQLEKMNEKAESKFESTADQMDKELSREIGKLHATLKQRLEAGLKTTESEVAEYKKKLMTQVEADVYGLISKVSEEVIAEAISPKKHEELVLNALDKYARL
jgi:F0F1-type ATP synthase membrane subunit b/b'